MPACVCGFRLGEKVQPLESAKLLNTIHHGVQGAVALLQKPPHRDGIETYVAQLAQVDEEDSTKELIALMDAEIAHLSNDTHAVLDSLLTPETIVCLNKALEGEVKIARRGVAALVEVLAGKQYRKAEIWQVIQHWVEGDETVDEDMFVIIEE